MRADQDFHDLLEPIAATSIAFGYRRLMVSIVFINGRFSLVDVLVAKSNSSICTGVDSGWIWLSCTPHFW
jgi:hypothetical protein